MRLKKISAMLLSFLMLLTVITVPVFAEDEAFEITVGDVTTTYSNLTDVNTAIANLKADATIKLLTDYSGYLEVNNSDVKCTFDLNGKKLSCKSRSGQVIANSALDIIDSSENKTGRLNDTSNYAGGCNVSGNGPVTIYGGTYDAPYTIQCTNVVIYAGSFCYSNQTYNISRYVPDTQVVEIKYGWINVRYPAESDYAAIADGVKYVKVSTAMSHTDGSVPITLLKNVSFSSISSTKYTFNGDYIFKVTGGVIKGNTFDCPVMSSVSITGGTFNNQVTTSSTISGGTFNGAVVSSSSIEGGTFTDEVTASSISGGTFTGSVSCKNITGGTFSSEPSGIINGYHAFDNNNGTWTVKSVAASIGSEYYLTFEDALADVESGETIKLERDIYYFSIDSFNIPSGVTIDMNKKSIYFNKANAEVTFDYENVTFQNGSFKIENSEKNSYSELNIVNGFYDNVTLFTTGTYKQNAKFVITGGYFNIQPSASYIADGCITVSEKISGKTWFRVGNFEVKYKGNYYYSLEDIIASAEDGDVITLAQDFVLSNVIYVDKNITLDLNGKKLTPSVSGLASATGNDKDSMFVISRGGKLTVDDATGKGEISTNGVASVYSAIKMTGYDDGADGDVAALEINAGTVTGTYYGITGNGGRHNTSIVVNGGTITATAVKDNLAIYNPQDGTVTINGGVLKGYLSAIEMRAGDLCVNGGSLTATATDYSAKSNGSGTTTTGAAIAISQHNTGKEINVNVNGGVITGAKSIAVNNVDGISPADVRVAYTAAATLNGDVYYTEDFEQNGNVINGIVSEVGVINDEWALYKAAKNGGNYKLGKNIYTHYTAYINDKVDLVLDLNGHSILADNTESFSDFSTDETILCVRYGGKLTINGNGHVGSPLIYLRDSAIKLTGYGETYDGTKKATLVINGGTFKGKYYAITGNGNRPGTDVTINGGTFIADYDDGLGMYIPQNGIVTINGGTFNGVQSALEVRSGDVTINGGTFTSSAAVKETSVVASGSGNTTVGAALAIAQHSTKNDINVTINGGTFTGTSAVSVADPQKNGTSNVDVALKGGTFNGELNYLAENFAVTKADDVTLAAPANYVWNIAGELVSYVAEDVKITVENEIKDIVKVDTVKTVGLNDVKEDLGLTTEQKLEYKFDEVDDNATSALQLSATKGDKTSTLLEISLYKTEDGEDDIPVTDTKGIVVETIFEFDMTGKANLGVKSYHDGEIIEYTNSKSGEDGTFYYDGKNIHIFTTRYSTFMFDYTTIANAVDNVYASVVLSDDISVNFIFKSDDFTQDMIDDLTVSVNGVTKSIVNNNDGTWKLANAITVDPVDIDKTFNVVFSSKSTDANKAFEYSVLQYCAAALKSDNASVKTICQDIIHYASACKTAFGVTNNLTGLSASVVGSAYAGTVTATDAYSETKTGTYESNCPITIKGATLVCGSTTGFRIYFTGSCERVKVDGKRVTPVKSGDDYYVEINSGIAPSKLDVQHTVTFDEGEGTHMNRLTVKVSPVNCMAAAASGSDANLAALAKTLYKYHSDAKTLF